MKIILQALIVFCLLILSFDISVAQKTRSKTKTNPPKALATFDFGTQNGTKYTNKFLEIQFSSPETWEIQPNNFGDEAIKKGKEILKPKNTKVIANLQQSISNTRTLFSATKGVGTRGYANILSYGEVLNSPFINSGTDYLRAALSVFKSMTLPANFVVSYEIKQDKLGANTLAYFETSQDAVKQRYYAIVRKGYGVSFIMTYIEVEDLEKMRKMLTDANLNFKSR